MTIHQAFILGILQGITEFLPVSSSGHLVLLESWFGLDVESLLSFDVVLHAGTLTALVVYFWKDLWFMTHGLWIDLKRLFRPQVANELRDEEHPREQVWYLIIATLPVVFVGPLVKDWIEGYFRDPGMVVMMLGGTAILLALAEIVGKRTEPRMDSIWKALLAGVFQCVALIPGVSRSGSTMVGGLLGNLEREAAAKFAFLMGIPAIAGAVVFVAKDMLESGSAHVETSALLVGFLSSALVSFLCIWGMLQFVRRRSLWWFVGYLVFVNAVWFVL